MTEDMKVSSKRRRVLQTVGSIGAIKVLSGAATAKESSKEYIKHSTDSKLEYIGEHINFHPSQSRAAFVSAAFDKGIELYVAEDVKTDTDKPSVVYQITSNSSGGVYAPEWQQGNYIKYQQGLSEYERQIPRSYRVLDHKVTEENVVDVEKTLENAKIITEDDE
ncbi:hypothetical protein [Natronolimnohabitans innermongolicus]|uniref:hypothetical protein n=1 Tax=Natronolimnohabitans innermongolicus TaxID=253107 RepID=UPI001268A134|nr:hypothetical protein [Natronolimnohabitans innermongolicus]